MDVVLFKVCSRRSLVWDKNSKARCFKCGAAHILVWIRGNFRVDHRFLIGEYVQLVALSVEPLVNRIDEAALKHYHFRWARLRVQVLDIPIPVRVRVGVGSFGEPEYARLAEYGVSWLDEHCMGLMEGPDLASSVDCTPMVVVNPLDFTDGFSKVNEFESKQQALQWAI
ncbi:hypothetical protein F0562_004292 [Nyssa sinensis]|uniref:Uncharacterized protein n=1 Tax=Nyssa sinensis TaxID=561372 RepID=A0A5J5BXF6_9ASTE|nr:hypothetical protein F0562_004292 [Nyssa sinensis]